MAIIALQELRFFREKRLNKLDAYVAAVELAIKTMDAVFMRLNAAENIIPRIPPAERRAMPLAQYAAAERAEIASYDVTPDHWGARLCLMSAWESLHAARSIVAPGTPGHRTDADRWREAALGAKESARLAVQAALVFTAELDS